MTKKLLFPIFLVVTCQPILAQDCTATYGMLKEGTRLEYTNYNKKGEADGTIKQLCRQVETVNDTIIATMDAQGVNQKGEETYARSYLMKCLAGVIYLNMQSTYGSQSASVDIQLEGGDLVYPADMKPGQTLPDAEMVATMSSSGLQLTKTRYKVTNRKVESAEPVTTQAGTFDCMKISYDLEMNLLGKKTSHAALWMAKNVGMVKTENYDKKGGVESSMQLTLFQN